MCMSWNAYPSGTQISWLVSLRWDSRDPSGDDDRHCLGLTQLLGGRAGRRDSDEYGSRTSPGLSRIRRTMRIDGGWSFLEDFRSLRKWSSKDDC